jgi:hypothetical protein
VIVAPLDLDDLLGLVHRINPARVSIEEYERRLTMGHSDTKTAGYNRNQPACQS